MLWIDLQLTKQMYAGTTSLLQINGHPIEEFCSNNGVIQGNNYSPTIFSLYINDLIVELKKCSAEISLHNGTKVNSLAYADDIVLMATSESGSQELLNITHEWCKKLHVIANCDKTKVLHFKRGSTKPIYRVLMPVNNKLERVEKYKYIGITLGYCLQLNLITDQLATAGSRALGQGIRRTKSNYDLSFGSYSRLFHSWLVPIFYFSSGAWSVGGPCNKIDSVQMHALRFYSGILRGTTHLSLIRDSEWVPGIVRHDINSLRLYNELIRMPSDRLTCQIFEFDCQDKKMGSSSKNIRSIYNSIGKLDNWYENQTLNIKVASKKLLSMYEAVWLIELGSKSKLQLHSNMKTSLSVSCHLTANLKKSECALISQI